MDVIDRVNELLDRAAALHEAAKLPAAEKAARQALALAEKELGPKDPNLAPILSTIARLRGERGDDDEAIVHLERAAALVGKLRNDPDAVAIEVDARRALGTMLIKKAAYPGARKELQTSLALGEKLYGKRHVEVARTLNSLGMLCKYTGRFPEGRKHYRRALAIFMAAEGPDSDDVAVLYHNMGGIEHAAGRFKAAEPPARKGVAIREKKLPPDDPILAEDIAALAAILDGLRKYEESEPIYLRVLQIFRKRGAHYDVAVNLHNLAAAHAAQGKHASSAKMYKESEGLKRKVLGSDHPDTALTVYCHGLLQHALGNHGEALAKVAEAEKVMRKSLGKGHPHTQDAARALGLMKNSGKKRATAERSRRRT
jgi:tetratricopeptide (TPR) repeat protein